MSIRETIGPSIPSPIGIGTNKPQTRRTKRVLCLIGVVVVLAVLMIGLAALRPSPYRRFVSAPLPDGTRYTFLYPKSIGTPDGGLDCGCPCVQLRGPASPIERLTGLLLSHPYLERDIMVVVGDPKTISLGGPSGWRVTARDGRYVRSEKADPNLFLGTYDVSVLDSRTGISYDFEYQYYGRASDSGRLHLDREDITVLNSFRVLPPGAPVPSP